MLVAERAQPGIASVAGVGDKPRPRQRRVGQCPGQHRDPQLWFGHERAIGWHAGGLAALRVIGPTGRQVKLSVQERVPVHRGVGQHHHALTVLCLPGRTTMLGCHPDALGPFLDRLGVVEDQHPTRIGQSSKDIPADLVTQLVGAPLRPVEQMLELLRRRQPGVLSQAPRVLLRHIGQHRPDHQRERHPRLRTLEQAPQPIGQKTKLRVPIDKILSCHNLKHARSTINPRHQLQDLEM